MYPSTARIIMCPAYESKPLKKKKAKIAGARMAKAMQDAYRKLGFDVDIVWDKKDGLFLHSGPDARELVAKCIYRRIQRQGEEED